MTAALTNCGVHNLWRHLQSNCSGLALVEFALTAPIMLVLISGGVELANYTITSMKLSAVALQVADNVSRIGSGDPLAAKKISEAQINDLLQGALAQGGNLNINSTYAEKQVNGASLSKNKARIIISSLESDPDPLHAGKNYIHWQRCYGKATEYTPRYGLEGANNLSGMGPADRQVYAPPNTAVIFVEVHYRYEPIFPVLQSGNFGIMNYKVMDNVAAMIVRDDRDLSQIYNVEAVTPSTCS
ncbi:MAG: TadE/TadG family type IV pilus assembly protein [Sphingobium sp.]